MKHTVPVKRAGDPAGRTLFQSIDQALESIRNRAHELFQSRGGAPENALADWFSAERELFAVPPIKLTECDGKYQVTVATPGFTADQLDVAVDDNVITIRGKAEHKQQKTGEMQIYTEMETKELFRRFGLPGAVDTNHVQADLADGILKVTLPKAAAASAPAAQKPAAVPQQKAAA